MHRRQMPAVLAILLAVALTGSFYLPAGAWAAAPVGLAHAFCDTDPTNEADFDLLGALRLLVGDEGLGGRVRPADALTRAEFAVLVLRLKGLEQEAAALAGQLPAFADAAGIPTWAWGYVNAAKAHGLVRGYDDGTFRPGRGVTLAEGSAMLTRLLEREDELDPARVWPESYLELGDRIGLSGRFAGHSDIGLDRSAISHLSANALTVSIDWAGSGRTLLTERYGLRRGLLQAAGNGYVTLSGQPLGLADPYVCPDGRIDLLVGRSVDVLILPGTGQAAVAVHSGAAAWCPDGYLGYLSDLPRMRALETIPWWQALLAAEAANASRYSSTGQLSTSRVRLSLPRTDGGEAPGFVRVKGTTDQHELMVRDHLGSPWQPIAVLGGRFDQRVYFTGERGVHRLQFMTPVPGKPTYYYEDLAFRVQNTLSLRNDPRYGAGFLWPRAGLVQVEGYVDVAGFAQGQRIHIQVTCGNEFALYHLPCSEGYFSGRIWLTHGPGRYEVRLCLDSGEKSTYLLTDAVFRADNSSSSPNEWAAPGSYVQSGNAEVRQLAVGVTAGHDSPYDKAKAIYRWVARNLTYDLARAADPGAGPLTTLEILARGNGVCEDYANVFAAMCRAVGVEARIATGVTISDNQNHAWNEFWAGGRWVSVDVTWGSGYVANGVFRHDPTDEWFDKDLKATHDRQGVRSDWREDV